jgi:UDP:flavonoid glycosyltransferase YjiC (YdhE family)
MMGSFHYKHLFLKILKTLNQTNYNIIAVNTIMSKEELPKLNDNILLKKFIKTPILVNKMVDLAVIHGGRGTVYNAAYSGKPVIGIPMHVEQQYNIDNIVRHKAGLRISKKFFNKQELLNAITTIFSNYDEFLSNAQDLSKKLSIEKGEEKAVEKLIETIK